MEAPIYQCRHGHTICCVCYQAVHSCPQCRVPLDKLAPIRTLALEQIVEQMNFQYPCKNAGCNVSTAAGQSRKNHQATCPHRSVMCLIAGCAAKMQLKFLVQHITQYHKEVLQFPVANNRATFYVALPPPNAIIIADGGWPAKIIGDNLICVTYMLAARREIALFCRYIQRACRYSITVEANGTKRCFGGWARPVDFVGPDEIMEGQYLSIPVSGTSYLTDGNKHPNVPFVVEILP